MFLEQLRNTVEIAPVRNLDTVKDALWRAYGVGLIGDDDAQRLAEAIEARQKAARAGAVSIGAASTIGNAVARQPLRFIARLQRTPDKARSIARRRQLAASGPLPPALAAHFTPGEQAVFKIIGDEIAANGFCELSMPEIAARAGVGLTTARNAIRFADGQVALISVERRPQPGKKNLTNVIRSLRPEWNDWLAKRAPRLTRAEPLIPAIGFKNATATVSSLERKEEGRGFRDRSGVWRPLGREIGPALAGPEAVSKEE